MAGNPHPVFQDGVPVEKGNARTYLPLRLGNADALRALDGSTFWLCYIQTLLAFFYRDPSDTTSADNGTSVIVDADGNIWKFISSGAGIAINAAGLLTDRDDFDGEDPGFTYFGTDTELLYVRLTAGGWSDGSEIVGPPGPAGADSTVPGPAGAPGTNGTNGASSLTVVRLVSTSNVTISSGLENGDAVDDVTLVTGDFVLLSGQTAAAENGVYQVVASGAASRATAFNTYDSMPGCYFSVMEGTAGSDKLYRCTSNKGGTLGTDALAFSEFASGTGTTGAPIVLLASGQSNIAMYQTYSWTPPENLFLWDFDGLVDDPDTDTGTAFAPMTDAHMGVSYSLGAKIAEANPDRPVYVVNIGNGGQPISKWLTGSPTPDMYDCLKRNIEAALTAIGVSTVDTFLWWQGEADAVLNNTGYASDFATLQARLKSETWFPIATPVLMMSVSPYYSDVRVKYFNPVLRAVAGMDPAVRTFVQTNKLPSTMWQSPELIHMTGDGYKTAGEFAYTTYLTGCAAAGINPWVMIFKPASETRTATTTLASDKYLRFPMKAGISYRVRGVINVTAAGTTAGFKYGWSGPACAATFTRLSVIQATETTSFASVGAGYPTNKTITPGAAFSGGIEFEMSVVAVSADGEFAFQWSQNTSDAVNASGVYAASYMEYVEG